MDGPLVSFSRGSNKVKATLFLTSKQNFTDKLVWVLGFSATFLGTQLHPVHVPCADCENIYFSWEHNEVAACLAIEPVINIYKQGIIQVQCCVWTDSIW